VGIDLGTTFSSLACLDEQGRPEVMENAEGELLTPSVVYFGEEGVIVGKEAARSGREDPEKLVANSKRFLGVRAHAWEINGGFYTPVDIAAFILRKLKHDFEHQRGPISQAVISVPAHFTSQQRHLTLVAARQAELNVLDLINEPVAAALTFLLGAGLNFSPLVDDQTLLVYDLGGGTFDLSLVRYTQEQIRVLAANGDLRLGGIDWNQRLIDNLTTRFHADHVIDLAADTRYVRRLHDPIEEAKRSLTNPFKSQTRVTITYRGIQGQYPLTRDLFESLTRDLVERTQTLTEQLVKDAFATPEMFAGTGLSPRTFLETNRHWKQIDQILPVGGSTRMPMIRRMLDELCRKFLPEGFGPNYKLSPDLAIAQGAALHGGLRNSGQHPRLLLKNVSHSLGLIGIGPEGFQRQLLIPRGYDLPCSVPFTVKTVHDNQRAIRFKIVEGEQGHIPNETTLCEWVINNIPAALPRGEPFDVSLTCQENGLLQMVARHRRSDWLAMVSMPEVGTSVEGTNQQSIIRTSTFR
jgi:molecular chaperone DnaK